MVLVIIFIYLIPRVVGPPFIYVSFFVSVWFAISFAIRVIFVNWQSIPC